MSFLRRLPGLSTVSRVVTEHARAAWTRDRTELHGLRAAGNRLFRMAVLVVRGIVAHRVAMLAASLSFFTVFSIVPMLVVVLWALKLLDLLPAMRAELPVQPRLVTGDQMLHATLAQILDAVKQASEVTGLVGLFTLLYVAAKMFSFTERALHTIAGAGKLSPRFSRAVGYAALFLVPPVVLGVAGILLAIVEKPFGDEVNQIVEFFPHLDLAFAGLVGFGVLWLVATLLYWAAVRARIPFSSASVGGFASAVALPVVFWAYADFQIGVTKASVLGSGFLAFPVFLLWSFSSWFALLVGGEIAVAHHVDSLLPRGATAFHLDLAGERQASVGIMVRLTRASRETGQPGLSDDELARALHLPPRWSRTSAPAWSTAACSSRPAASSSFASIRSGSRSPS